MNCCDIELECCKLFDISNSYYNTFVYVCQEGGLMTYYNLKFLNSQDLNHRSPKPPP